MNNTNTVSIAITGSGGSGAVTTGMILLKAMAQAGFYGIMSRSSGPQIRGGESAVLMRFSDHEVYSHDDSFHVLLCLDWLKIERFADEIPLHGKSLLLGDTDAGEIPGILTEGGAESLLLPFKKRAGEIEGGRSNMIGLGVLAMLLGISADLMKKALQEIFGHKKDRLIIEASAACIEQGMKLHPFTRPPLTAAWQISHAQRWNISGNEAAGLGALKAGVRFVAAYPITPASEILEWLSPNLEKVGGALLQAEDELASINMIIGASFGGVPALTATSGPGLSLMMEGLGLAVASETPVVVVNVMRGGPSTGIPTKSEQADLNLALFGFHGDAPHIVLAPTHIKDCVFTVQWASCLAEQLQTVTIVMSDQFLGQSRAVVDPPQDFSMPCERMTPSAIEESYQRYELTENGISAMSIPGTPRGMYTADGLEHGPHGTPSSMAQDHLSQMSKRRDKLLKYDFGERWAEIEGAGDTAIVTWGSVSSVVQEAAQRLRQTGITIRVITVRLLMPLPLQAMKSVQKDTKRCIVVEQNQSGQFYHYLKGLDALESQSSSFARPGPLLLRADEIVAFVEQQVKHD
ncbi:MAG: 2-oxoacid:acceptor oxidoreductase subunit alpha [Gammaproteobacteria bacterium]|nr:2-oxoacid:acceptor oxidoreductase subunit alpha [Gammaproteobacteria bacterium]